MKTTEACPDADRLLAMLDAGLTASEQAATQIHVDQCPDCQQRLERLLSRGLDDDLDWEQLGEDLRRTAAESDKRLEQVLARVKSRPWDERTVDENTRTEIALDFLVPSDNAEHLGRLGPYEITDVVGQGGMGVVLKGHDAKLNRVVAIKVLAPELAGNAAARKRFLREAQAAAAVTHQHVVTIHAVDENECCGASDRSGGLSLPYLVMEYVDGFSLQEKIEQAGHLGLKEILRIGSQVAAGLAAAHAQGLIHRDVKPSNILLENGVERVRVSDFGLARAVDDVAITRTGEVTGTPQYMSPEQAQGLKVDARSDLFSLGCVLYAMCTGRSPFRAETTIAAIRRVCDETPRPIREVNADVPAWLTSIIDRLLQKEPNKRFQSADEVADLLGKHLAHVQDPGSTPQPGSLADAPRNGHSRRRRRWLMALGLFVVVAGGLGITEATGVTRVADYVTTVLRIRTPQGTLILEIEEPGIQVAIEGGGEELTISGAGIEQLQLRPGQYQVRATKDGKPVREELVTITRDGRQLFRVSLEAKRLAAEFSTSEPGAFVILGHKGFPRKFDTLADAVQGSSPGDTIEIRGNGPFITEPMRINHALTIRAADGFRPVIRHGEERQGAGFLISTTSPLVLEGLDIQRSSDDLAGTVRNLLGPRGSASVHVANCRFLLAAKDVCVSADGPGTILRNCEFLGNWAAVGIAGRIKEGVIDNCVFAQCRPYYAASLERDRIVNFTNNTLVLNFACFGAGIPRASIDREGLAVASLRFEATGNILACGSIFAFFAETGFQGKPLRSSEAEAVFQRLLNWNGRRNLYSKNFRHFYWWGGLVEPNPPIRTGLEEWKKLWPGGELDSLEGAVQFHGGDLRARAQSDPWQLTPEDFRLRPNSAGYRAGPDGKDLGADVDLVGPGEAYERWKQTPEYQVWLEETNRLMGEPQTAEVNRQNSEQPVVAPIPSTNN